MRIMTSNIWGEYFKNPAYEREGKLLDVFKRYSPHILGLQEVTSGWYSGEMLKSLSADYGFVATNTYGIHNFVPLLYLKERFRLLSKGYEPLWDTMDKTKGISWVALEDLTDGKKICACNTHFWWRSGPEHDVIRIKNAEQLAALMKSLEGRFDCAVFSFGDLNSTLTSPVFETFKKYGVIHVKEKALTTSSVSSHHGDPARDENGIYRGQKTDKDIGYSLDHILVMGQDKVLVSEYKVVEDQDALDTSDHSPVYIDFEIL